MLPDSGWLLNPHLRDFNGVALNRHSALFELPNWLHNFAQRF